MNVLILGGTLFVGRHIAEAAVRAGMDVTLFNRGKTSSETINGTQAVHGDRHSDLHRLDGRNWDVVIDTCGYTPGEVELAVRYFSGSTRQYIFISTISVYDETSAPVAEDSRLAVLPQGADRTRMTPETYGPLKVLCEEIVQRTFAERAAIVRPALVAGPFDPTDRFTYWPIRYAAGGTVLAPEAASHPLQYIDARDLADFTVNIAQRVIGGLYNAVTTPGSITFRDLFDGCLRAAGAPSAVLYLSAKDLSDRNVAMWSDLPLWIAASDPAAPMIHISNARALTGGLHLRPIAETVRDTLTWAQAVGKRLGSLKAGLTLEREGELLASLA